MSRPPFRVVRPHTGPGFLVAAYGGQLARDVVESCLRFKRPGCSREGIRVPQLCWSIDLTCNDRMNRVWQAVTIVIADGEFQSNEYRKVTDVPICRVYPGAPSAERVGLADDAPIAKDGLNPVSLEYSGFLKLGAA